MSFPNILEVQPVALTQRGNALAGTRFFGLGRLGQDNVVEIPGSTDVEAMKIKVRNAAILAVSSTTALGAVGGAIGAGKGHRGMAALGGAAGSFVGVMGAGFTVPNVIAIATIAAALGAGGGALGAGKGRRVGGAVGAGLGALVGYFGGVLASRVVLY